jgi:tetraacyldisaccharide 4'-kinase
VSADVLRGTRVFAFAGIGRPGGYRDSLVEAGAEVVGERWFRDHYEYRRRDVVDVVRSAEDLGAIPITTAKDAVKIEKGSAVWVLESEMVPVVDDWQALWRLVPGVGG